MTKIKTNIDNLFKQKLSLGRTSVTEKSMSVFKKRLARKSFFSFSYSNFNIYYAALGVGILACVAYGFLSDSSKKELDNNTPIIKKVIVPKEKQPEQIEKNTHSDPETKETTTVFEPEPLDLSKIIVEPIDRVETAQEDSGAKQKTQTIITKEETPVTALKPEPISKKSEAIPTPKKIMQKDTVYKVDTVKTVVKKVRVNWKE